jgi:hypothetical protein
MDLPDELVSRVRAQAAQNREIMTADVRAHPEAINVPERDVSEGDPDFRAAPLSVVQKR